MTKANDQPHFEHMIICKDCSAKMPSAEWPDHECPNDQPDLVVLKKICPELAEELEDRIAKLKTSRGSLYGIEVSKVKEMQAGIDRATAIARKLLALDAENQRLRKLVV